MQQELKIEIVNAANAYLTEKGISANDLSKISSINAGYLSNMLRMQFTVMVSEKPVDIADRWFKKLAASIGFNLEQVRWETEMTVQFMEGVSWLEAAKANGQCGMIIGETGAGKTFFVDKFCLKHPSHTYRITVSNLHTLPAIMEDMLEVLGLNGQWRMKNKLDLIARHMQKLKGQGENVIFIMDESENLKIGVIRMLKALYDKIADHCSIMLIATPELINKLERMKKNEREGIPQFCRRFKAGTRYLTPVNKNYTLFLNKYVKDNGLRKLLLSECDNYGELHDYLFPVIREAHETGKPLTEELFRIYHNMPKF
ncbi:MAG: AAA family ATPase [Flavipsychrobacter sp.]